MVQRSPFKDSNKSILICFNRLEVWSAKIHDRNPIEINMKLHNVGTEINTNNENFHRSISSQNQN